ncbi:MAG: PD-(D/E)XK nuclease-like domain-containing protein [Ekhidna sp.]|nr:PD-(D/E)XK nuclease-like domain-containing protein [Ekhidna sp.]
MSFITSQELINATGKGHLSKSSITYAIKDMKLWLMYMKGQLKKESEALTFGSLYDMLLFERDKAMDTYVTFNEESIYEEAKKGYKERTGKEAKNIRSTKEYKELLAQVESQNDGKTVVSPEDWKMANEMIDRLDTAGLIRDYMTGEYQVGFLEEVDGVPVKGFLDCLNPNYISDSKSCRAVSKFKYDALGFGYDIQAYLYKKVFKRNDFWFVAQEKTFPYKPQVFRATDSFVFGGEMKWTEGITKIRKWLDDGGATDATIIDTYYEVSEL